MKGFLSFVISILLIAAILGGIYVWYTGEIPEIPNIPGFTNGDSTPDSESYPRGPEDVFDDYYRILADIVEEQL